jgi:hypothetical protein
MVAQPKQLALATRKGNVINNVYEPSTSSTITDDIKRESNRVRGQYLPGTLHRDTEPSISYNCHGLTFGSRRTWISDVSLVLEDDEYTRIKEMSRVQPGDIVIWRDPKSGDISHSGVVVEYAGITPRVLGKWGNLHEAVHFVNEGPYTRLVFEFWRLKK